MSDPRPDDIPINGMLGSPFSGEQLAKLGVLYNLAKEGKDVVRETARTLEETTGPIKVHRIRYEDTFEPRYAKPVLDIFEIMVGKALTDGSYMSSEDFKRDADIYLKREEKSKNMEIFDPEYVTNNVTQALERIEKKFKAQNIESNERDVLIEDFIKGDKNIIYDAITEPIIPRRQLDHSFATNGRIDVIKPGRNDPAFASRDYPSPPPATKEQLAMLTALHELKHTEQLAKINYQELINHSDPEKFIRLQELEIGGDYAMISFLENQGEEAMIEYWLSARTVDSFENIARFNGFNGLDEHDTAYALRCYNKTGEFPDLAYMNSQKLELIKRLYSEKSDGKSKDEIIKELSNSEELSDMQKEMLEQYQRDRETLGLSSPELTLQRSSKPTNFPTNAITP